MIKIKPLKTKLVRVIFFDFLNPSKAHTDLRLVSRHLFDYCTHLEIHQIDQDRFKKFSNHRLKWSERRSNHMWRFLSQMLES
ncbi:hypothetical protein MJH12_19715 [bacterium]|nr:hypothetical protein [bacterium]